MAKSGSSRLGGGGGAFNVPLSRFGVLAAQLESIAASARLQPPDPLLCFDLLSDLLSSIEDELKESLSPSQRKCEDALHSLIVLGPRRPVRRLAALALVKTISSGDVISVYSRASSLQGWLSDAVATRKPDPLAVAAAAQSLGQLYRFFGRKITAGLPETVAIATKLMRFVEDFVRQEAMELLENVAEGCGGSGNLTAYSDSFRAALRLGVVDRSSIVRIAAARCLKALAGIKNMTIGITEFENLLTACIKAFEDPIQSVRDAFSEAFGSLLARAMNPDAAQIVAKVKAVQNSPAAAKKLENSLEKHLVQTFARASGTKSKDVRVGLALSWVFYLQMILYKYKHPDTQLQDIAFQVISMLSNDLLIVDAHPLACVLYILRVGIVDQMMEVTQRSFLLLLGEKLDLPAIGGPSAKIAVLRTLSYLLRTLGEVPPATKDVLEGSILAALSHPSALVRVEAALTFRALAEVDSTSAGNLISCGVTGLRALRESIGVEKGERLKAELAVMHGQAASIAAVLSVLSRLPLGCPTRLPKSVFALAKDMLVANGRNLTVVDAEREAGWMLLASCIVSMDKEDFNDQVFDILSLWTISFGTNLDSRMKQVKDFGSELRVLCAAMEALTAFIQSSSLSSGIGTRSTHDGVLLQPVLMYLSTASSFISSTVSKSLSLDVKPAFGTFVIRTLAAYESLADPTVYKSDHSRIIQICSKPFKEPQDCEDNSLLRVLLDKRDSRLGPWSPGRDWFEDELRAFDGGDSGVFPCLWEDEVPSFPQPVKTSKLLVDTMLSCSANVFAFQESEEKLRILGLIDQSLKSGKRQWWREKNMTNACAAILCSLKAAATLGNQSLSPDVLNSAFSIIRSILMEGDICKAQRRAASEALGLLARLGSDTFTARMTRSLLSDLVGVLDETYAGSIAFALGCIHRSAGGIALSTLVPATVNSISSLAKSSNTSLQVWALHALLITIEAAGLSFISHVQATLLLATDILLAEENGSVEIRQSIGHLINVIVAVLGPELTPGSVFFSRCQSVISEISSGHETTTLFEFVRFTQHLILFAPQAVPVQHHVQTLLPTLSSRQPTLRLLAVSTLRHLIEKDPSYILNENIEENLLRLLDEETDSEIGRLVRATILRLLHASCPFYPSRWIRLCRSVVLASAVKSSKTSHFSKSDVVTGNTDGNVASGYGEDDEDMISTSSSGQEDGHSNETDNMGSKTEKHLRYRTRVFAAECLSYLLDAVGSDPAHFDLILARERNGTDNPADWLVLHVQDLVSLAYQISTSQFEMIRPIGVSILSSILDKFQRVPDPDLPGRLLMEQYQAQFISAVRTALDVSSSPLLLEASLDLAPKILTSGITMGDQIAIQRVFQLILQPLDDLIDLYYPSYGEWVASRIKLRFLAAHASVKSYAYMHLKSHADSVSDDYASLFPAFSTISGTLGQYWILLIRDFIYVNLSLKSFKNYKPFIDGIQSSVMSPMLKPCLNVAGWASTRAVTLDAIPLQSEMKLNSISFVSGHSMVKLESSDFLLLWGIGLLLLFQRDEAEKSERVPVLHGPLESDTDCNLTVEMPKCLGLSISELAMNLILSLSAQYFYFPGMLSLDLCLEILQALLYVDNETHLMMDLLSQIAKCCPDDFFENDAFGNAFLELSMKYLHGSLQSCEKIPGDPYQVNMFSVSVDLAITVARRLTFEKRRKHVLALLCTTCAAFHGMLPKELSLLFRSISIAVSMLVQPSQGKIGTSDDEISKIQTVVSTWASSLASLSKHCIDSIHLTTETSSSKHFETKLSMCLKSAEVLARQGHEAYCLAPSDDDEFNFSFSIYKSCINCIQICLLDGDLRVQKVGLHAVKAIVQQEVGESSRPEKFSFMLYFVGELFEEMVLLVQRILQAHIDKETSEVVCGCLKLLILLHGLSKASECQKDMLHLFLELIIMVSSSASIGRSKDLLGLRSVSMKLVSHLVLAHSAQFKEVLIAMEATQRQYLQDMLRSSVALDQNTSIAAVSTSKEPISSKDAPHTGITNTMDEEDDWDAFQSTDVTSHDQEDNSAESNLTDKCAISEGKNTVGSQTLVPFHSKDDMKDEDDWDTFQSTDVTSVSPVDDTHDEVNSVDESPVMEMSSDDRQDQDMADTLTGSDENKDHDSSDTLTCSNDISVSPVDNSHVEVSTIDESPVSGTGCDERKDYNSADTLIGSEVTSDSPVDNSHVEDDTIDKSLVSGTGSADRKDHDSADTLNGSDVPSVSPVENTHP